MYEPIAARRREFDDHLWDHMNDVFQMGFDIRRPLMRNELDVLNVLCDAIDLGEDDESLARTLQRELQADADTMFAVMQAAGLTRNKIIVDLKASTATLEVAIPGKPEALPQSPSAWKYAGPYLATRIRKVLEPIAELEPSHRNSAFEAINQSTYPGWIRQERAKRQGHEAEHRVAVLLLRLGIPFAPEEKAENPLCRDAQIDAISYDIVVPNVRRPVMVMKSTVQTANIGQFGESKAHLEVSEAQAALRDRFGDNKPALVAMIDGVGFRSNTQGLHGVLSNAEEFAQFKSVWKVAVVAAGLLERPLTVALPPDHWRAHDVFLQRYENSYVHVVDLTEEFRALQTPADLVDAGEAALVAR